MSSEEDIYQ